MTPGLIVSLLIFCWLVFLGYTTIVESKEERTRRNIKILVGFLVLFFVGNTIFSYNHSQYRTAEIRKDMHNFQMLQIISMIAGTTAENLERFLYLVGKAKENDHVADLHAAWGKVLRDGSMIIDHSAALFTEDMKELEITTRELKRILSSLRFSLYSFNEQFLRTQAYSLTPEELEKMYTIIDMYHTISKGIQADHENVIDQGLIESLQDPMKAVNPNYIFIFEQR